MDWVLGALVLVLVVVVGIAAFSRPLRQQRRDKGGDGGLTINAAATSNRAGSGNGPDDGDGGDD
jgi:hypothetical protein